MKAWSSFYPFVLPDVTGCAYPTLDNALMLAAREFCERTLVWQIDTDTVSTEIDEPEYTFDIGRDQEVIVFKAATLDSDDLPVIAEGDLPSDWRANRTSQPNCAFTLDRLTFTIVPTPAAVYDLTTTLIVRPSLTAAGVEDRIFNQYARQISYGAKAMLMLANDKPYSNLQLAAANRALFDQAISKAAITHQRGHAHRRRRVCGLNF